MRLSGFLIGLFLFSFLVTILLENFVVCTMKVINSLLLIFQKFTTINYTSKIRIEKKYRRSRGIILICLLIFSFYVFIIREDILILFFMILAIAFFVSFGRIFDLAVTQFTSKFNFIVLSWFWILGISLVPFLIASGMIFFFSKFQFNALKDISYLVFFIAFILCFCIISLRSKNSWFFRVFLIDDYKTNSLKNSIDSNSNLKILQKRVILAFQNGYIGAAIWYNIYHFVVIIAKTDSKNFYKITLRYLYRKKSFEKVVDVSNFCIEKLKYQSDTILGIKSLSLLNLGQTNEARILLDNAIGSTSSSDNHYLWLYSANIYWHLDDLDEAVTRVKKSIILSSQSNTKIECPIAYRNLAYYMVEKAMLEYRKDNNLDLFNIALGNAEREINYAANLIYGNYRSYNFGSILHTKGLILFLQENYQKSMYCFLKSINQKFTIGPRFHLGFASLMGASSTNRARYQFDIINSQKYSHKFKNIAQKKSLMLDSLDNYCKNRYHKSVFFNKKIFLYQFASDDLSFPDNFVACSKDWPGISNFKRSFYNPTISLFIQSFNPLYQMKHIFTLE